jgi:hypothetical protein
MNLSSEKIGRALRAVRGAIAVAIATLIIVGVAALSLFQSSMFQAALKVAMKENVPRGWFHGLVCLRTGCNPFKVIDPADPRFRPENFRFEDYPMESQLVYVIGQIVPRGMSRDAIEQILVKSGGASVMANKEENYVHYTYRDKWNLVMGALVVSALYPDKTHVERVWVHATEVSLKRQGAAHERKNIYCFTC